VSAPSQRRWLVLSVPAPPRGEELLLVDALRRLGARLVERDGERFVAQLPEPAAVEKLIREAEVAIRASTTLARPAIEWRWGSQLELAERWRRDFLPRRVTERLVVAPVEGISETRPGDLVVRLHPRFGFGTAGHPTTRLCLSFLEVIVRTGDRIADVGAGSGILAIAAALLGSGRVVALESDSIACDTTRDNIALNGVGDRVEVRAIEVGPERLGAAGPFDGIVANLEARILLRLLPGFRRALPSGGWVILSGILPGERQAVAEAAAAAELALRDEATEEGWWAGVLRAGGT
jgi:ribosomal protein L11 methyltransferase